MKLIALFWYLLLNEVGEGSTGVLGGSEGDPDPSPSDDQNEPPATPDWHQLYDQDLIPKMEWAKEVDGDVLKEPSLKPFVGPDGQINLGNVLKSYVHTKKQVGKQGVQIPDENATEEQINDFYAKLGYIAEPDAYKGEVKRSEDSAISEEEHKAILDGLHSQKVPVATAKKIVAQLEENKATQEKALIDSKMDEIEQGVEQLRTEWGQAFEKNVGIASKVLKQFTEDSPEVFKAIAENPEIANHPALIKVFSAIGSKIYDEGDFKGPNFSSGAMTPSEATEQINQIKSDMKGPYWNKSHPSHKDAVAKMKKLYEYKNA